MKTAVVIYEDNHGMVGLAVDYDGVFSVSELALELTVHGVILQHVSQVISGAQVVDANDLDFGMVQAGAEDHTADTTEAIDANFDRHNIFLHFISPLKTAAHYTFKSGLSPSPILYNIRFRL